MVGVAAAPAAVMYLDHEPCGCRFCAARSRYLGELDARIEAELDAELAPRDGGDRG